MVQLMNTILNLLISALLLVAPLGGVCGSDLSAGCGMKDAAATCADRSDGCPCGMSAESVCCQAEPAAEQDWAIPTDRQSNSPYSFAAAPVRHEYPAVLSHSLAHCDQSSARSARSDTSLRAQHICLQV